MPLQTPDAVGKVLEDISAFQEADVAMVGLGNSLATADTSLQENYLERTRPEAVDALRQGGIDIVSLSGDQTMEFGRQGLTETLEALDSAGIYRVGAGRDYQEARRPEILEVKGQRIAYFNYAPNSNDKAMTGRAGLNIQARKDIVEDIAALRPAVDWVVVNYRWYGDLDVEPNEQQVNLSRAAIDAGADLVVGYHSHQLQGAELYKSRPIVYSLGDFIFQDAPLDNHDTVALRVSLRQKQMKVEFLPISVREARPQPASGKTARTILKTVREASAALSSPLQFPAILEAMPRDDFLIEPPNPFLLKTLGELEPASITEGWNTEGWNQDNAPAIDVFEPAAAETNFDPIYRPEALNSKPLEPHNLEPQELGGSSETNDFIGDTVPVPTEYQSIPPLEQFDTSPVDGFGTHQPDASETSTPYDLWNAPASTPASNIDTAPEFLQVLPNTPTEQLSPVDMEQDNQGLEDGFEDIDLKSPAHSNDILQPSNQSLPQYESLDNWGEKSSPHQEFSPIQERLNSLELSDGDIPDRLPTISSDRKPQNTSSEDAIPPHDEPLVGPLS
ncbi:MAG: CapA family protein [Symploca sp. SIO2G7]|nr:CapA family protein [Symploca sp. SIO2G7]